MRCAMLQTSCQASRTISCVPGFRRTFLADAKNPCKMRLSCMYGTNPRKRDRCRPSRAQAADTATESCLERQKIVAKNFFGYRRGIRSRPIEMRVKTRESPEQPIRTRDVARTARTIDALENARRNVGRATILDRFASPDVTACAS